jgi:hypothetical protein
MGRWRCGEAAEIVELVQAGEAADEHAGVDRAGDARAGSDGGDDGEPGHLAHIPGGQAPAFLGDQDDPVGAFGVAGEQRGQGDVAGASQHDVRLAATEHPAGTEQAAIDDLGVGAGDHRRRRQRDARGHVDGFAALDGGHAQEHGDALARCGGERDGPMRCCVQGEGHGDGRRPLTAACAGDHD